MRKNSVKKYPDKLRGIAGTEPHYFKGNQRSPHLCHDNGRCRRGGS